MEIEDLTTPKLSVTTQKHEKASILYHITECNRQNLKSDDLTTQKRSLTTKKHENRGFDNTKTKHQNTKTRKFMV